MKRCVMYLLLALPVALLTPICHAQDSIERGLLRQAPKLIKYLKAQGYKNVGVLKFLVSREGQPFTDNVGTMNLLAALRLETLLKIANDPAAPIGIIENASEIARKIPGASHLSKEGRKKLFTGQYPLAWGKETVQPDAFLTGTTEINKNLRTLTVTLYCLDRVSNKLVTVGDDFQVANTTDRLAEIGESFTLRGGSAAGPDEAAEAKHQEKVFQEAVKVREKQSQHPAQQADPPVALEVLYDSKTVALEFRGGKAYITEPQEGQAVAFRLKRDAGKERYGVVLKINGENTLDKQRLPDLSCRRWILDPGVDPLTIAGYQIGDKVREKFRVASLAESKEREVNYGHDVGTITMTVFREQKGNTRPKLMGEEERYQTVLKKLTELPERPTNYLALKAKLLEDANRGLIVEGNIEASKVQVVAFTADPTPVMCLTIVYYHK